MATITAITFTLKHLGLVNTWHTHTHTPYQHVIDDICSVRDIHVDCDVNAAEVSNAARYNVNVKFDIKYIIATNKFLSDMFNGFSEIRDNLKTKVRPA